MKIVYALCLLVIAICSAAVLPANAQAPAYDWVQTAIVGNASAHVKKIVADTSGNIYVAGHFGNTLTIGTTTLVNANPPSTDIFVAKFDTAGNFHWARKFGYSSYDYCNAIALDPAGNLYLTGQYRDSIRFDNIVLSNGKWRAMYVAKLNPAGQTLWAEASTGAGNPTIHDEAFAITFDPAGNFYIGGSFGIDTLIFQQVKLAKQTHLTGSALANVFIAKFNSSGVAQWMVGEGAGTIAGFHEITTLAADSAGNVYAGGKFNNLRIVLGADTLVATTDDDGFCAKISSSGSYVWARHIWGFSPVNAVTYDNVYGLVTDGTHVYVTGNYRGNSVHMGNVSVSHVSNPDPFGLSNPFLFKLDTAGQVLWGKAFGLPNCLELIRSIHLTPDQQLLISGRHRNTFTLGSHSVPGTGNCTWEDGFLSLLDTAGTAQWVKVVSGANHDSFFDAIVAGGKIYTTGVFSSPALTLSPLTASGGTSTSFSNVFLSRLSFAPVTGAPENAQTSSVAVYPNPAHDQIRISGAAPIVRCLAFTSTGQQLELLVPEEEQEQVLQLSGLQPGLYIVRLYTASGQVHTVKILKQ